MKDPTRVALPSGWLMPLAWRRKESKYWFSDVATILTEILKNWTSSNLMNPKLAYRYIFCFFCTDQSQSGSQKEDSSVWISLEYQTAPPDLLHLLPSSPAASSPPHRPAPRCCRRTGWTSAPGPPWSGRRSTTENIARRSSLFLMTTTLGLYISVGGYQGCHWLNDTLLNHKKGFRSMEINVKIAGR